MKGFPMKLIATAILFASLAGAAHAKIPFFNATCPTGIDVHADEGGPVYINGKEAKIKKYNSNAYDATHGHTTVNIGINPDGSLSVMYTGKNGANGICTVVDDGHIDDECPADVSEANRYLYPACN